MKAYLFIAGDPTAVEREDALNEKSWLEWVEGVKNVVNCSLQ